MLEYFHLSSEGITVAEGPHPDCWVNLADPTPEELETVAAHYQLPSYFLTDSLDPAERPNSYNNKEHTLLICKTSLRNPEQDTLPFLTVPIGIILTSTAIITICTRRDLVRALASSTGEGTEDRQHYHLALNILKQVSVTFIKHLEELDDMTGEVESHMRRSMRNEYLARMMQIEKNLVYFATSIKGNRRVMEKVSESAGETMNKEEKELMWNAPHRVQTGRGHGRGLYPDHQ